jgi:hypothetical protein
MKAELNDQQRQQITDFLPQFTVRSNELASLIERRERAASVRQNAAETLTRIEAIELPDEQELHTLLIAREKMRSADATLQLLDAAIAHPRRTLFSLIADAVSLISSLAAHDLTRKTREQFVSALPAFVREDQFAVDTIWRTAAPNRALAAFFGGMRIPGDASPTEVLHKSEQLIDVLQKLKSGDDVFDSQLETAAAA